MKHPTKDPSPAEQERIFLETWERENAGMNGRYDPNAPQPRQEAAPRPRRQKADSLATLLLEAARGLPDAFHEWELMRHAWLRWPRTFGVKGVEEDYPSDKKVSSALSGKRGLVSRGLLVRLPGGKLRVASPPG